MVELILCTPPRAKQKGRLRNQNVSPRYAITSVLYAIVVYLHRKLKVFAWIFSILTSFLIPLGMLPWQPILGIICKMTDIRHAGRLTCNNHNFDIPIHFLMPACQMNDDRQIAAELQQFFKFCSLKLWSYCTIFTKISHDVQGCQ